MYTSNDSFCLLKDILSFKGNVHFKPSHIIKVDKTFIQAALAGSNIRRVNSAQS